MKIGFVSLPLTGHLNPMTALARKLQSRGHDVVLMGVPEVEGVARAANLNFVPFCEKEYPEGAMAEVFAPVAKLRGLAAIEYGCAYILPDLTRAVMKHLPKKLAETGIEALVIDFSHRFLELVPLRLNMPYVQIWNILPNDFSGATPSCLFSWPHETTPEARARNIEGVMRIRPAYAQLATVAKAYAEEHGMKIDWSNPAATVSKLAVIAQTPKEFDFKDIPWPAQFHYAGPFYDDMGREQVPFTWEKLTGEPLIYASMGTLVNGFQHAFRTILEAAAMVPDTQLVLSVGSNVDFYDLGPIPSNAIVVRRAPQIELLKRAALCITHAGLNTALESLAQGVPIVAIPIAFDQPGVAVRIAYHGVGEFVELEDLSAERLSGLIRKVLENAGYRDRARYFQKVIADTRGLDLAADVIEQAFHRKQA